MIYLADLNVVGGEPIVYHRVATLPYQVHQLALLPSGSGFATLQFDRAISLVTLRTHSRDGSVLHQLSETASAAYGRIVVNGPTLAVCISSGRSAPERLQILAGNPEKICRVDAADSWSWGSDVPTDLVGDQLLVWNTTEEGATRVDIPQDPRAPMLHSASFSFLDAGRIVLAGFVPASFGMNSALLKVFSIDNPAATSKTFTHGQHPGEPVGITREIATRGSSAATDIVIHSHHSQSRLSAFHRDLLTGQIESSPTSKDPPGLIEVWNYPSYVRTSKFYILPRFPHHAGSRVLVLADPPDDVMMDEDDSSSEPMPHRYLLDFSQSTLLQFLRLTDDQRTALSTQLAAENTAAQVKVVTRRFVAGADGEEEDAEYLWPTPRPQEWEAHLLAPYQQEQTRQTNAAPLEYDEGPEEHRPAVCFGYIQSQLALPSDVDRDRMAITTSGLVEVPVPEKEGRVFYFVEGNST